ncbi:MAG: hypothetical protein VW080_08650 [Flavobacteriaceae bacterium]
MKRKFHLTVALLTFLACSQDNLGITSEEKEDKSWLARFKAINCPTYDQITNTTWILNGFVLYHTDGLKQMALSGSTLRLNEEYCNFGLFGGTIPSGLGDDFQEVGYGERLNLNGWLIAKYTSTETHPDNWIMYRISDGYWERWDLAENEPGEPRPFILGNSLE